MNIKKKMMRTDGILNTLKITHKDDVNSFENKKTGEVQTIAPLIVEGGASFNKGIKLGIQENLIPGLIIYDGENFLGFSEKFGLCLLNTYSHSTYLELPTTIFQQEKRMIQSKQSGHFNEDKEENKKEKIVKNLKIEIEVKEIPTFYLVIPEIHNYTSFELNFDINLIFGESQFLSQVDMIFINESNRKVSFQIQNEKIRYEKDFERVVEEKGVKQVHFHSIKNYLLLVSSKDYD